MMYEQIPLGLLQLQHECSYNLVQDSKIYFEVDHEPILVIEAAGTLPFMNAMHDLDLLLSVSNIKVQLHKCFNFQPFCRLVHM